MARRHLPDPDIFIGLQLAENSITITKFHKRGNNALLFEAYHDIVGHKTRVACKAIPAENLRTGWDSEIEKPNHLPQAIHVVRPRHFEVKLVPKKSTDAYALIVMNWIDGSSLRDYLMNNRNIITADFCLRLAKEIIIFLHAMKNINIQHSDIHAGNILIEKPNPAYLDDLERIWLTDFGIGGSMNDLTPKDDFVESSKIISEVLNIAVPNAQDGKSRYTVDKLQEWLVSRLADTDSSSIYYRDTREFNGFVDNIYSNYTLETQVNEVTQLKNPFDYMSSDHMGNQYELLQTLFAYDFPDRSHFLERSNTILTGPRGCGKTMITKSLSTKALILGGGIITFPLQYFGIYYHAQDLYFAFPHLKSKLNDEEQEWVTHYFNMAITSNIIDSLDVISQESNDYNITEKTKVELFNYLKPYIPELTDLIIGMNVLSHLRNLADNERLRSKRAISNRQRLSTTGLTGIDYLTNFAGFLQESIEWLNNIPAIIFIDDYSTPRISESIQACLNRIIFQRSAELLFKVATESITTFHPYDSDGKLLETGREYDLIDLGGSFLHASIELRSKFIQDVIDKRLEKAIDYQFPKIEDILGDEKLSYNEIARIIKRGDKYEYNGFGTYVDLCSGDITHILSVTRDTLIEAGGLDKFKTGKKLPKLPVPKKAQNRAIREIGINFLNNIEAAPGNGPRIRRIAEAFGKVAGWELRNLTSKNVKGTPPKQASRIEVLEMPVFEGENRKLEQLYKDLLRYGVFFRDVRGKSRRGVIVPRLYLRRLLIPSYLLTFSKRDNVGMEVDEFMILLKNPEEFAETRIRRLSKGIEDENQADMF